MMQLYSSDRSVLMEISKIEREGRDLVIKGKVLGTMPMTARLTPQQCRKGLKLLSVKTFLFLLTLPFRKA
jgi:hypothetical protein